MQFVHKKYKPFGALRFGQHEPEKSEKKFPLARPPRLETPEDAQTADYYMANPELTEAQKDSAYNAARPVQENIPIATESRGIEDIIQASREKRFTPPFIQQTPIGGVRTRTADPITQAVTQTISEPIMKLKEGGENLAKGKILEGGIDALTGALHGAFLPFTVPFSAATEGLKQTGEIGKEVAGGLERAMNLPFDLIKGGSELVNKGLKEIGIDEKKLSKSIGISPELDEKVNNLLTEVAGLYLIKKAHTGAKTYTENKAPMLKIKEAQNAIGEQRPEQVPEPEVRARVGEETPLRQPDEGLAKKETQIQGSKETVNLNPVEKTRQQKPIEVSGNESAIQRMLSENKSPEEISKALKVPIEEINKFVQEPPKVEQKPLEPQPIENIEQLPKENSLITEAKKYKSADEFIKQTSFSPARDSKNRNTIRRYLADKTTTEPIDILEPNKNNPKIDDSTVKTYEQMIEDGQRPFILVDNNKVIDGHNKLQAYKNLGFDEAPTISKKQLTDIWNDANQPQGKPEQPTLKEEVKTAEKQPYEMTKDEFIKKELPKRYRDVATAQEQKLKETGDTGYQMLIDANRKFADKLEKGNYKTMGGVNNPLAEHYESVKQALKEGKTVPENVLKDYPDLKPTSLINEPENKIIEDRIDNLDSINKGGIFSAGYDNSLLKNGFVKKARNGMFSITEKGLRELETLNKEHPELTVDAIAKKKIDEYKTGQLEEPTVKETSETLATEKPKKFKVVENKPKEIIPPKGSNAAIINFADGKQSKIPVKDIDVIGTDLAKIATITYGKADLNRAGGIKWETFKEVEKEPVKGKSKKFSDIVNESSNKILESEKERMQKESLGSGELKSTFIPFSSLIEKITGGDKEIPKDKIVSSGNEKFDNNFLTDTPTWKEKRLKEGKSFLGLMKEKIRYLDDVKSDPILKKMEITDAEGKKSNAIDYISADIDILRNKLTSGVKETTQKTLYSIFGDMKAENLETGIYNVGKYAGAKRLKSIVEDPNTETGVREKLLKEYTKDEIDNIVNELDKKLTPEEKRSYERMNKLLTTYGEELVSDGMIEKTTKDYFPFRVIDHINKIGLMNFKKGSFQKETPQSSKHFGGGSAKHVVNVDVMQVLSDYFRQNERAKAINEFESSVLEKFHDATKKDVDGWMEYEFNPKRGYIKLYSTIEKIMKDASVELPKDVRQEIGALFFGGGKKYIVPEGLSKQLSNLYAGLLPSQIPVVGSITKFFKKQMVSRVGLFNVLFQARNMRTDMKKVINNNPASFSALPQTEKFLFDKINLLQKGYLHTIDLISLNKIIKQGGRIDKAVRKIDIKPEQYEQAWEEFQEGGLGGRLTTEAYEITEKDFNRKFLMKGLKKDLSEFYEGRGVGGFLGGFDKTMQMRETILRFNQYVYDRFQKNLSRAEAHENVGRTFINYNHFTEFENKWLRNFIAPFYSWAKGNPETVVQSFVKGNKNARARILAGLLLPSVGGAVWNHLVAPEDEEKLNNDPNKKYIADNFHFATNWFDKNGNRIYMFDQSWEDDIMNYINLTGAVHTGKKLNAGQMNLGEAAASYTWDTFYGNAKTLTGYINPLVKMPFEITANKNFYSGYPIWKENDPEFNKIIKLGLYEGFAFDRNATTIRNLFVGKQDWSMKGMRLSGLPVTSVDLSRSESNYEVFNKHIMKEKLQEITDFEKERDKLKDKTLKNPTEENKQLYQETNNKLKALRSSSPEYQKYLEEKRAKQLEEDQALGKSKSGHKLPPFLRRKY